jgi:hypothetical protein
VREARDHGCGDVRQYEGNRHIREDINGKPRRARADGFDFSA